MALLDKGMKRRDFLKASAATAAVGLAGCAPSTATDMAETGGSAGATTHKVASDAAIIEGKGEWMPIHCHQNCNQMCLNMGYVVDGVVVRQKTDDSHADSFDCPQQRGCLRGRSLRQQVYNADRIKYPMKRKNWQPGGGENAHGELRGKDEWERISWDEAIDTICTKIKEYQAEFGSGSVCSFTYGTTEPRNMYNLNRLENVAQFSHQNRTTDFALTQGTMYTAGGFYYQGGVDMDLVSQMNTFVVWGHNPIVSWPNAWHYIADAIENNDCKLIVVDPNKNTIGQKADLFVSLQPGTDAALALGLAKIIEEEGKTDDAFMQQLSLIHISEPTRH